jgi:ribonuclease P protein component
MRRLKKRAEFLAVAKGQRSARRAFVVQTLALEPSDAEPGCGFTVTKKVGNAPARNRIRRRLREAVRLDAEKIGRPGFDHVVIGRREALSIDFVTLCADLAGAMAQGRKAIAKAKRSDRVEPDHARFERAPAPAVESASVSPSADFVADASLEPQGETPGRTR